MKNDHSQAIPEHVLKEAQARVDELIGLLSPYMLSLTPSERQEMLKMGEKSLSFVEKAHEFAKKNPNLCPPFLNMAEFDVDFADAHGLWVLQNTIRQASLNIDDTAMAAGSEAYQAALVFYNSVKVAAAQDIPGAKAVYEELKKRYPGGKRKQADEETPSP
ncbi:MAG: hypothetical protein LBQ54_02700, partial [Planctomycetaceae bacterium]|nr:hypothetical protein [Planctomycetaceae bacterium]